VPSSFAERFELFSAGPRFRNAEQTFPLVGASTADPSSGWNKPNPSDSANPPIKSNFYRIDSFSFLLSHLIASTMRNGSATVMILQLCFSIPLTLYDSYVATILIVYDVTYAITSNDAVTSRASMRFVILALFILALSVRTTCILVPGEKSK